MGRTRKQDEETSAKLVTEMATQPKEVEIEEMPLNSLGDYMRYNRKAREINKKLKVLRYPIKQCPVELHPYERIVFTRNDQPTNPLPVYLSNEMIHFDRTSLKDQLRPGNTYDLPRCVIQHLAEREVPIWKWFDNSDGSKETRKSGANPRFALRTVYAD